MTTVLFLDPKGTGCEVIHAARRRGYRTIVLSTAPSLAANAASLADQIVSFENWDDTAALDSFIEAQRRQGDQLGVYFNLDVAAAAGTRLRHELALPAPSPSAMDVVLDKKRLRDELRGHGLSSLRSASFEEARSWTSWPFPGAAYFKPVHGAGSAYVVRITNLGELRAADRAFQQGNQSDPDWIHAYIASGKGYHVEEEIQGELLSIEGINIGGRFHSLGLLSRILYSQNPVIEMGSCFPYPHPAADRIEKVVAEAHAILGLSDGPTHTEVIVAPNGKIEIIDLNPRIVGADVLWSINFAYDIALEDILLDWALGSTAIPKIQPLRHSCLQYVLPPRSMRIDDLALPEVPEVLYKASFVTPGTTVASANLQLDHIGCYLTVMPSFEEAVQRSLELRSDVRINGTIPGSF